MSQDTARRVLGMVVIWALGVPIMIGAINLLRQVVPQPPAWLEVAVAMPPLAFVVYALPLLVERFEKGLERFQSRRRVASSMAAQALAPEKLAPAELAGLQGLVDRSKAAGTLLSDEDKAGD